MLIIYLTIVGFGVGILSSFFGIGGGVLAVPALYTIFPNINPQIAIGSSLGLIFINSVLNTINFLRAGKRPIVSILIPIGIFIILGVITGSYLTDFLKPITLKYLFGIILIFVALRTYFSKTSNEIVKEWQPDNMNNLFIKSSITAFISGVISGMTGLGGGAILVPLFLTVLYMPFGWVPVYSNIAMGLGTFAGLISYLVKPTQSNFDIDILNQFQIGQINVAIIAILFLGALVSAPIGVKLTTRVKPNTSKKLYGALLLIIATKIFLTS